MSITFYLNILEFPVGWVGVMWETDKSLFLMRQLITTLIWITLSKVNWRFLQPSESCKMYLQHNHPWTQRVLFIISIRYLKCFRWCRYENVFTCVDTFCIWQLNLVFQVRLPGFHKTRIQADTYWERSEQVPVLPWRGHQQTSPVQVRVLAFFLILGVSTTAGFLHCCSIGAALSNKAPRVWTLIILSYLPWGCFSKQENAIVYKTKILCP